MSGGDFPLELGLIAPAVGLVGITAVAVVSCNKLLGDAPIELNACGHEYYQTQEAKNMPYVTVSGLEEAQILDFDEMGPNGVVFKKGDEYLLRVRSNDAEFTQKTPGQTITTTLYRHQDGCWKNTKPKPDALFAAGFEGGQ